MPRSITFVLLIIGLTFVVCGVIWIATVKPWLTPEQTLQRFYSNVAAEDTLMDPLILRGKKVVPLIMGEVQRRDMPRRRYAIGFLGNGPYPEAISSLEKILGDETEKDYIRGDTLKAIYQIDSSQGIKNAELYVTREDTLGEMARQIRKGSAVATDRRSYLQALLGMHD
jgi:hypothetical protein